MFENGNFLRGLDEAKMSQNKILSLTCSHQKYAKKKKKRYAKHVDQDLVEQLNNLKTKLKDLFVEEVLTDYNKYSLEIQSYHDHITTFTMKLILYIKNL